MSVRSQFLRLVAFLLLANTSLAWPAQEILYQLGGPQGQSSSYGHATCSAGDIDADGFSDFIAGAPYYSIFGNQTYEGGLWVYAADGSGLHTKFGASAGDSFGWSVCGVGDVNNDGFGDFMGGAPFNDDAGTDAGSIRVFSGLSGQILYELDGALAKDWFGYSVCAVGDINQDGFDDFAAGAPASSQFVPGSVRVISGADGSDLFVFFGDSTGSNFGWSVSGAGDVNMDGYPDVIVGIPLDSNSAGVTGSARIYSGMDGLPLFSFEGDSFDDRFGISVSGAGDVDADGYADVIIGSSMDDTNGTGSGSAYVYSGLDGSLLYHYMGQDFNVNFGNSVSGAGDVNADGFDDVIVGAEFNENNWIASGSATVYSGKDGAILFALDGELNWDLFGTSVSAAGDVNRDGFDDFLVGADNRWNEHLRERNGSIFVYEGGEAPPLFLDVPRAQPGMPLTLQVSGATPNGTVYFAYGLDGLGYTSVPQLNVVLRLVAPKALPAVMANGSGDASLFRIVPMSALGLKVWVQAFERDAVSNWVYRYIR